MYTAALKGLVFVPIHNVHRCLQITLIAPFFFSRFYCCLQITLIAPFFFSQCTPLSTNYTYCSIFLFTMYTAVYKLRLLLRFSFQNSPDVILCG